MSITDPRPLFSDHIAQIVSDVQKVLNNNELDSIVLFSGEEKFYHADDVEMPFRPTAHFARFCPVRRPNRCVIVEQKNNIPTVIVYKPIDYWLDHSEQGEEFWKDSFTVVEVDTLESFHEEVKKRSGKKAVLIGEKQNNITGTWNSKSVVEALDKLRAIKTPYEIACLKAANEKAVIGHITVQKAFESGASEKEMYWEYLKALNATEHDMPYPPIIALNEKGSVLHYEHRRDLQNGHSCLIDAGMSVYGYGSDITRTFRKSGTSALFESLISAVDTLQQELVSQVTVGSDMLELDHHIQLGVGNILKEHDLISVEVEEAVSKDITHYFIPHSVGHMLGLQTHDVGGREKIDPQHSLRKKYPHAKSNIIYKEGMVTTVEPGIYFNSLLMEKLKKKSKDAVNWKLVDELVPFGGIRIEDNIHVTKIGPENLTRAAFDTTVG